jgi:hypothetical protein
VNVPFLAADAMIISAQAALVGLPGAGVPRWLDRAAGRGWALILPLSIAVVVAAITLVPETADALTWIALVLGPARCWPSAGRSAVRGRRSHSRRRRCSRSRSSLSGRSPGMPLQRR